MPRLLYVVRRTGKPWEAQIFMDGNPAGEIRAGMHYTFILTLKDGSKWRLTNHVHGERRPFSMRSEHISQGKETKEIDELIIRNHVFVHKGKFYVIGGTPTGSSRGDTMFGRRYIIRIDNFPFERLEDVDELTMGRLIHHRGVVVGEIEGLGIDSHRLSLDEELADVGLILAACSYLMYSTG